ARHPRQRVRHVPAPAAEHPAHARHRHRLRRRGADLRRFRPLVVPDGAAGGAMSDAPAVRPATRQDLEGLPVDVAPLLLGGVLRTEVAGATVAVRLTEVEAYHGRDTGDIPDPGSHARMGRTARNATMWGEPG